MDQKEKELQATIKVYWDGVYSLKVACATDYRVSRSTLRDRLWKAY